MRNIISRYVAGWILVILTVGLMTWELTTRKGNRNGPRSDRGRLGSPDEGPR
jgi:hypothetical protein